MTNYLLIHIHAKHSELYNVWKGKKVQVHAVLVITRNKNNPLA